MDTLNEALGLKIPQHVAVILDGNGRWAKQETGPAPFRRTQTGRPYLPGGRAVLPEHRNPVSDSVCIFNRKLEAFYGGGFNTDDHSAYIFKGLCQKIHEK